MTWWCAATGAPWTWSWQAFPGVWLVVILVAGSYALALRRRATPPAADDDRPVAAREVLLFGLGVLALWAGLDWPVGLLAAGYLLSARTAQYLLFVLVAPPLLLLGMPRWLLRRLLRRPLALALARRYSRPLPPLLLYNAVLIGVHLPPVVEVAGGSQLTSFAVDMLVIGSGLVFWWPALARLPELAPMGYPGRIGYLLLSVFVPTVPAVFYTYARYPIYRLYELAPRVSGIPAVADQQVAGLMMKTIGGLILFTVMSVMFFRWHRIERDGEAPAREAAP
ncbi:MAG TPA: cytochrome c oxidase assembly protein [Gemmatimonadales bacterium]|jgi:putative membrane protein